MFELSQSPGQPREDLRAVLCATWEHLVSPGTWWSGHERRQIAEVARRARLRQEPPAVAVPETAVEAASLLAVRPAHTTEDWVAAVVAGLGSEERYVELVGVVVETVATDTLVRLLGSEPEPFLDPAPGEPTRVEIDRKPRRGKTWITMGPMPVPPFVLSLVPEEMEAVNRLEHALYMTGDDMQDPDFQRGRLHRTQIELVASAVSHGNECFY